MKIKHNFSVILILLIINIVSAQKITYKIDKTNFKINEPFKIEFGIEAVPDSITHPNFKGFTLTKKPTTLSSSAFIKGKKTEKRFYQYALIAKNPGNNYIKSPVFYIKNKPVTGKGIPIHVSNETLSEDDLALKKFKENRYKPKGTYKYVFKDDMGYIEVFENLKWKFHRKLTEDEIQILHKIK